jgi:integrase
MMQIHHCLAMRRNEADRRVAARRLDCPFVFHRDGEPLGNENVRPRYYEALEACGFPTGRAGFTLYDTKKTAMGVMVDAGLTVEEIMAFSGHKNRAMVERYIVRNAERQARSVDKRDEYLRNRLAEQTPADAERLTVFPGVSKG